MKTKKLLTIIAIFILFIIFIADVKAQDSFEPGTPAPELSIYKWMSPEPPAIDSFAGKTLVLEFWATWCKPCIMAIPHINELVDKFACDSVSFVSISKEDPKKVEALMKNKEMKAKIAIDQDGKTNTNYKIRFIPKAYVIDSFGKIVWEGHPLNLTDAILKAIIEKKHIKVPENGKAEG